MCEKRICTSEIKKGNNARTAISLMKINAGKLPLNKKLEAMFCGVSIRQQKVVERGGRSIEESCKNDADSAKLPKKVNCEKR